MCIQKIFSVALCCLLINVSQAVAIQTQKGDLVDPLLCSEPGGSGAGVKIHSVSLEVAFFPDSMIRRLSGTMRIPLEYVSDLDQPLMLEYSALTLLGLIDSVSSLLPMDSIVIGTDTTMLFFGENPAPGQADTLIIWFFNKADIRGANPLALSSKRTTYFGYARWCPFPANYEGRFVVDLQATVPEQLAAVSMGELQGIEQTEGQRLRYHWRELFPGRYPPYVFIDSFQVDTFKDQDMEFAIYHLNRPDSIVNKRAAWLLEAFHKYAEWFGPLDYKRINMVEGPQAFSIPYFSLPGTFVTPEGHFGGRANLIDNSDGAIRKSQSHELAHQWWAHKVDMTSHRWMMECWAEYAAIREQNEIGPSLAHYMRFWLQPSVRLLEDTTPLADSDNPSLKYYKKGPWVLYMLERLLGEDSYLRAMRSYQEEYSYVDHSLDDFFRLLEETAGQDLDWFRREWFEKPGFPSLTVRDEYEPRENSYLGRIVITQESELFNIPLEVGVYYPGGAESELISTLLKNTADTLIFECAALPDSVVIDPDIKTLVDVNYGIKAEIAQYGDTPNSTGDYEIPYYVDTATAGEATVFYRANGGDWSPVSSAPDLSGYGTAVLPAQNQGSRVEYYLFIENEKGVSYKYPPRAPEEALSFSIKTLPTKNHCILVPFMTDGFSNQSVQFNPFKELSQGVAGFNMESLEPFGTLYGAGNIAPQLDSGSMLYLAYNRRHNTLDLIALDSWKILDRIELPEQTAVPESAYFPSYQSAYDPKRQKYYLKGSHWVCEVNIRNRTAHLLTGLPGQTNFFPGQIEYLSGQDILLLKQQENLLWIDPATNTTRKTVTLNSPYELVLQLTGEGVLRTIEYAADMDFHWPTTDFSHYRLISRRYRFTPQPVLIDSVVSEEFEGAESHPLIPYGNWISYLPEINTALIALPQTENNRLIWTISGQPDALKLITGSYSSIQPVWSYSGEDDRRIGIYPSSSNCTLTLVDLMSGDILEPYYSPFSGGRYSEPHYENMMITGIVSFVSESRQQARGDINQDGRVDIYDILELIRNLRPGGTYSTGLDINLDDKIDIFDLVELLVIYSSNR